VANHPLMPSCSPVMISAHSSSNKNSDALSTSRTTARMAAAWVAVTERSPAVACRWMGVEAQQAAGTFSFAKSSSSSTGWEALRGAVAQVERPGEIFLLTDGSRTGSAVNRPLDSNGHV
jgi:hypothetical protein